MKVLKFGGSSVGSEQGFNNCLTVTSEQLSTTQGIVVVSALGGITDQLTSLLSSAKSGQLDESLWTSICDRHHQRLTELQTFEQSLGRTESFNWNHCQTAIESQLHLIHQKLLGIELLQHADEQTTALVLGSGEELCATLFSSALQMLLPNASIQCINSRQVIKTDGSVLDGIYDEELSRVAASQFPMQDDIWICPGFIAMNEEHQPTLLGRNGSDLSAAILASLYRAKELQIWTDVDGVYNADPSRVRQAKVVSQLSYREAMELSYFGAKVLHPKTIAPIASHQIPTRIKNTLNPDGEGTLITAQSSSSNHDRIAGVTSLDNLAIINLSGANLKGTAGLAERVFHCVSAQNISIVLISQGSSEYAISICVKQSDVVPAKRAIEKEFKLEIKHQQMDPPEIRDRLSSITVVGDSMKQTHGVAAKFFSALALANVNIIAIAQDSSEGSISAVVRQSKADVALNKVFEYFFECPRTISVILYGVGTIGAELLSQIETQQAKLRTQRIELKVVGIANSKQLLWRGDGLSLNNWKKNLALSKLSSTTEQLLKSLENSRPINPVFVDCTSSDQLSGQYNQLFEHGLHIVAANKKANTSSIQNYQKLRQNAHRYLRKFAYETNVGAGLPIIANIQNQVRSGDQLLAFGGILSGSLSYIMGELDNGLAFSEAVKKAKEKGFTEPDPRDDLNGMDIARKLLIIAREFGAEGELDDVIIESLLPPELFAKNSIDEFMQALPEVDRSIQQQVEQAKAQGQVLRYAGTIDQNGQMKVSLIAVNASHPLFPIKDGENAFSFHTQRYDPVPLVIRGYGAGADVTAAGVFGDILQSVVS
ncbi:bifunctional aspartate kinase/homoserine dehydrogenase I [Pleionea litopenaei]|uniref:Bifunctional aspartokinase/homoserine dehydrogenase n=1 Tax=Pleionea litopenaei TaxID=3070815 RepID=A0AA51RSP1_9GAMM|nr:bifunctional aspartate kinase/homoserine dehydrogenase I [Pleionea sp. HL-JVS1]WMS86896.1 bifunctional aspartate kinase/homoserine dehydrogenase I [Pleionea sp. HL-JVS1]